LFGKTLLKAQNDYALQKCWDKNLVPKQRNKSYIFIVLFVINLNWKNVLFFNFQNGVFTAPTCVPGDKKSDLVFQRCC